MPLTRSLVLCTLLAAIVLGISPSAAFAQNRPNLWRGLQNGLQRLFGNDPADENPEEVPEEDAGPDIDVRRDPLAPVKIEVADLWRRAERRLAAGDAEQSYELLRHILTKMPEELIYSPDGKLISIQLLAQEKMGELPEEYRTTFIQQYEQLSRQEFDRAIADNDPHKMYAVASRYLLTASGQQAANWLGAYHFDHGRYGLAAYWFEMLLDRDAPMTRSYSWQSKLLLALIAARKEDEAKDLRRQIATNFPEDAKQLDQLLAMWDNKIVATTGSQEALDEWGMPFGSAGRNGIATGGDPLLMPRWQVPLTGDQLLQERLEKLAESLTDDQESLVMPAFPVFIDGYAAFRTLKGLVVLDAETGTLKWETQEEHSPEEIVGIADTDEAIERGQIFNGMRVKINGRAVNMGNLRRMLGNFDSGVSASYNPLTQLLFKNATYSTLSADEQRIYTLENVATLAGPDDNNRFRNGDEGDLLHRDWTSNNLVAYDLRSGRRHWTIGGPDHNDEFDFPLAGYFFHSAPIVYRNELLVVGEKNNEIQLLALAPQTGALLWKQLLAFADTDISTDSLRRNFGGQVAVADGVIVCPTAAGWLVGIDAMTHSVLWANRYNRGYLDDESTRNWRRSHDIAQEIGDWRATPPFISQNAVIYAPPEADSMGCYDLQTGELLWGSTEQGNGYRRQDALFIGGVWSGFVIVAERTQLVAYDLKRGRRVWKHAYTEAMGQPSGFGVMNETSYYVPFNSGQVVKLHLEDGELEESFKIIGGGQSDNIHLGNLSLYGGMMYSFSWNGLQSFEQLAYANEQIAKRKQENAQDPYALLKEAEILLLDRNSIEALEKLKTIDHSQLGEDLRPEFQKTLRRVFQSEQISRAEDLEWGLGLLEGDEIEDQDRLLSHQLRISNDLLNEDFTGAFANAIELIDFARQHPDFYLDLDGRYGRKNRIDIWLAGELREIWNAASEASAQVALAQQIDPLLAQADAGDVQLLKLYCNLFDFYPPIQVTRDQLAESLAPTAEWHVAEFIWRDALTRPVTKRPQVDDNRLSSLRSRLSQLMKDQGLMADALYYEELPTALAPDEGLTKAINSIAIVSEQHPVHQIWRPAMVPAEGESPLSLRQLGQNSNSYDVDVVSTSLNAKSSLPWFRLHHVAIGQNQRVSVTDVQSGQQVWSVPLRNGKLNTYDSLNEMTAVQHVVVAQHGEMVSAISPVDKRVLWTKRLMVNNSNDLYQQMVEFVEKSPLQHGKMALRDQRVVERPNVTGMIAFATPEVVGVYGRRRLDVLDLMTGERLWSLTDLPRESTVIGNRDILFLRSTDPDTGRIRCQMLSTRDGGELELEADLPEKIFHFNDQYVVTIEYRVRTVEPGESSSRRTVRENVVSALDPLTGTTYWSHSFDSETDLGLLPGGLLVGLTDDGIITELDLNEGTLFEYEAIPEDDLKGIRQFYALADEEHFYLIGNEGGSRYADYVHVPVTDALESQLTNGKLFCLDRRRGIRKWTQTLEQQRLIVDSIHRSPWLVFASGHVSNDDIPHQELKLKVLDRQTGKELFRHEMFLIDDVVGFQVYPDRQVVELMTNQYRLRIGYTQQGGDAAEDAQSPTSAPTAAEKP